MNPVALPKLRTTGLSFASPFLSHFTNKSHDKFFQRYRKSCHRAVKCIVLTHYCFKASPNSALFRYTYFSSFGSVTASACCSMYPIPGLQPCNKSSSEIIH